MDTGYDAARLEEGRNLWAVVDGLAKKQGADYGAQYEATQSFEKAWATANAAYIKTLKVSRVAFGGDSGTVAALKLYGPRKLTIAGWMDQATTLYANLSSDTRLSAGLVRFGYNAAPKGHPLKTGTGGTSWSLSCKHDTHPRRTRCTHSHP